MTALPPVSCYCSVYGRIKPLESLIESFLRQDYKGKKELVILNDFDKQTLRLENPHPEIRIINCPRRLTPLGYKFNVNISMCKHDILMPFESDDIFLPNAISFRVPFVQKRHIFHTNQAYFEESAGKIIRSRNIFHCNLAFSKKAYLAAGQYPQGKDTCAIDVSLMDRFRKLFKANISTEISWNDVFYVYRWSTVESFHGSGLGAAHDDISGMAAEIIAQQVELGVEPVGEIVLKPHYPYEYGAFLPPIEEPVGLDGIGAGGGI